MVAAASASSLVLPAAVAAAAYSSLSVPFLSFPPGVPLLSQHTALPFPDLPDLFSFLLGGIRDSDPDPEVVSSAAAEAVNYRAEETAVVPRAG